MRILNADSLTSHGNVRGRKAVLDILEAGMVAADPYENTRKLLRVEGGKLIVGNPDFEPRGAPRRGYEVFDLSRVGRIFVFGAAKGIQWSAKAIEDVLGDRLTGGCVIPKHGDESILKRIEIVPGAHPVPDEGCVKGCQRILELCQGLCADDLVFTIVGNGVSSLLTLPVPGVTLEEVRRMTYLMQIERGAPTWDLNQVRNHLDVLKGGRISRYLQPARAIHIVLTDPMDYRYYTDANVWLHTLPECSTFADAVRVLKNWNAWDEVAPSIRAHLEQADPAQETVKAAEFEQWDFRIFGVMPDRLGMLPMAMKKAEELGYRPVKFAMGVCNEASQAGQFMSTIALNCERDGSPFEPPCALFTTGELLVTVGKETGVGGRNQEWALAAAAWIASSENIVMGAVDTDGTDGPGTQFSDDCGDIPCLAGGIVDGQTVAEARALGIDMRNELARHNSTPALWKLNSGIVAAHNVSLGDLGITLIMGRAGGPREVYDQGVAAALQKN